MSHIPDMQAFDSGAVAIGWLHPDHPFPQADPAPEFLARLKAYAARSGASATALGLGAAGGYHACEFCGRAHGTGCFGVPAGDRLFSAPAMIAHYVEEHRYAPAAEFIAAVMAGPLPGTREYVTAVAPFVARRRASTMTDAVSVALERDVALVLFDFLSRLSDTDEFLAGGRAEQVATWTLVAALESILVEPLDPEYDELLERARRRVVSYGSGDPVG